MGDALASLDQWEKSIRAYEQVMRLVPNEPDVLAGYGEMLEMAADGVVTPAARKAFAVALARDPANDVARFYATLAAAEAGESQQAIDLWLKLLADVPEDSEMREEISRRITESAQIAGIPAPARPAGHAGTVGLCARPTARCSHHGRTEPRRSGRRRRHGPSGT